MKRIVQWKLARRKRRIIKRLEKALKTPWDGLDVASSAHRSMEDAMVAAMAMRDRVDQQVDDAVRAQFRAAQGVYGAAGRQIKALYPGGLSGC